MTDARVAYTFATRPGWGHPEDVVPVVAQLAAQDSANPRIRSWALAAVKGVGRDDVAGEARALLDATLRDLRYTRDPVRCDPAGNVVAGVEFVQAPRYTLADGGGDCDDLATLLGAAFQSIGRRVRFLVGAYDVEGEHPKHILLEVAGPDGWISVDPVPKPRGRVGLDARVPGIHRAWNARGEAVGMSASAQMVRSSRAPARLVRNPRTGAIVLAPSIGQVWTPGRMDGFGVSGFEGLGIDPYSAALSAVLPYVNKAIAAAKSWLFGGTYDAYQNFTARVAEVDGQMQPAATPAETIAALLAKGIVAIYCSDSEGTRNNIIREFGARGWTGKAWSNSYDAGLGRKTWWYGCIFKTGDAPAAIIAAAQARAASDLDSAWSRTMKLCTDAKHLMRSYGGPEDYAAMILDAVPVLPAAQTTTAAPPPGAQQVTPPRSTSPVSFRPSPFAAGSAPVQVSPPRATTAPAATLPSAVAQPSTAATLPTGAPAGAVQLPGPLAQIVGSILAAQQSQSASAASVAARAFVAAGGRLGDSNPVRGGRPGRPGGGYFRGPRASAAGAPPGFLPRRAYVVGVDGVVRRHRLDGVPRRHRLDGVGLPPEQEAGRTAGAAIVGAAQGITTGSSPTTASPLEHLARQAVYAVTNPDTVSVDTTRRRLLAFQQAAGLPLTGDFDAATRAAAATAIGAAWVSSLPLRTFREAPTSAQMPSPVQVAPPGTVPTTPTSTGLPAGVPTPSATAPGIAPAPGTSPAEVAALAARAGGGVMVSPPGSIVQAQQGDDAIKLLIGIGVVAAIAKHKRPRAST